MNKFVVPHFLMVVLWASGAWAAGMTYHGRLVDPNGYPVIAPVVQFRLQIRSPGNENCLLYQEVHLRDMSASDGVFAITINDGTASQVNTEPFSLDRVFQNRGTFTLDSGKCALGNTYIPQATDGRRFVVAFNDGSFSPGDWENLPPQAINFVPSAMESLTVGGYGPGSLLRVHDGSGNPASVPALSSTQYNSFLSLLGGASPLYLTSTSSLNGANLAAGSVDETKLAAGIAAAKITGDISGRASGFTGALSGDVTGAQGATSVVKLRGRDIDTTPPQTGQVLKWNGTSQRWEPAPDDAGVATEVTASLPLRSSGGDSPNLTIDDASTSAKGVVRLAASSDATAGLAVQANDSRLTDARAPTGTAGGDLGGSYPNPDVVKIRGAAVSATAPQAGQVMVFGGARWEPAYFGVSNLKTTSGAAQFASANCSPTQTLTWSSLTDAFVCVNIDFPAEVDPKVGANTVNALSKWDGSALVASGVHESGGNVGIGTASPYYKLDLQYDTGVGAGEHPMAWMGKTADAGGPGLYFGYRGDGTAVKSSFIRTGGTGGASDLVLGTYGTQQAVVIKNDGNVGIGVTNPSSTLDVAGKVTATAFGLDMKIVTASQNTTNSAAFIVSCPAGYKVMGGGCNPGVTWDSRVVASYPNSPTSWVCNTWHDYAPVSYLATGYAICVRIQ